MVPLLPDSSSEFHESFAPSETEGPLVFSANVVISKTPSHVTWLSCRLKSAISGLLACSMDPDHVLAELVLARGFSDHRRTNVGPVCVLTYRMHRRVALT